MSLNVRRGEWLAGFTGFSGATGATGGTGFSGTTGIVAFSACSLCAALNLRWCPGKMSGFAPKCCMRKKLLKEPPICALQATLAPPVHQGPLASQVGHNSPARNVHLLCNSVKNALNSHILHHIPYPHQVLLLIQLCDCFIPACRHHWWHWRHWPHRRHRYETFGCCSFVAA